VRGTHHAKYIISGGIVLKPPLKIGHNAFFECKKGVIRKGLWKEQNKIVLLQEIIEVGEGYQMREGPGIYITPNQTNQSPTTSVNEPNQVLFLKGLFVLVELAPGNAVAAAGFGNVMKSFSDL
jgi:hypothetical protein